MHFYLGSNLLEKIPRIEKNFEDKIYVSNQKKFQILFCFILRRTEDEISRDGVSLDWTSLNTYWALSKLDGPKLTLGTSSLVKAGTFLSLKSLLWFDVYGSVKNILNTQSLNKLWHKIQGQQIEFFEVQTHWS